MYKNTRKDMPKIKNKKKVKKATKRALMAQWSPRTMEIQGRQLSDFRENMDVILLDITL